MPHIHRSALVMHSSSAMFDLVNDVLAYPEFLPWCSAAEMIEEEAEAIVARLEIAKGGVKQSFTTRNRLHGGRSIKMELIDGPFKYLTGSWEFTPLNEQASKVSLKMDFEFAGGFGAKLISGVFSEAANKLVDAFCQRAREIYA